MKGADLRRILSKNIKSLRSKNSVSQAELAEKADISIPFLSNIERGIKWPHPETLVKIAKALDVEVFTLFQDVKMPLTPSVRKTISKFKKDITVTLHKKVREAIDITLESIGSYYIEDDSKNHPIIKKKPARKKR